MLAVCVFQFSCFSKDSFLLADHLYSPLATSRKLRFVIQSLNSCSFLHCEPTQEIDPFSFSAQKYAVISRI